MSDPVVVVATFFPSKGMHDSVHALIQAAQTAVYNEPGCLLYSLHEAADRFVLIEKWESASHLREHGAGEGLGRLVRDLQPLLTQDIEIVELVPAAKASDHPAATVKGADLPGLPPADPPPTAKQAAKVLLESDRAGEAIPPTAS
ncbi:MAG: antibiotic biosynthesis monooxygenase [Bifidobacteriaceae bacterium]|jgi:quinol monooxygenase YgiN|nr:antibiotic biosynthesis monooxygenase [Bifidobacteriaceae bacterium]